ncbi:MAG: hypothetical protein KAI84_12815, partial [Gammaproteobacteria bacterium]|nr:hypothetical protein [Gammaproteobacteria bacterium]
MDERDNTRIQAFRQLKKEIRGSKEHLIVGIDIGKIKHHAFLGTATGEKFRSIIVENSASGFEHLLTMVQFFSDREKLKKIVFGSFGSLVASMMAARMAWHVSGAGIIPSVWA